MGKGHVEDWATKAARRILEEFPPFRARGYTTTKSERYPTEDRIAAIIALHAEPILRLLREASDGRHSRGYNDEGCDYPPCQRSDEDAKEDDKCTCGADKWNARVDAALAGKGE